MTILGIVLGFVALLVGAIKDFGGYDEAATALGLALLGASAAKEWLSMRRDLAPMRARRALHLCILVPTHLDAARVEAAQELRSQLLTLGFGRALLRIGARPAIPADTAAVIIFHPSEEEAPRAIASLPGPSRALVLAHGMVKSVRLSERVTAANSVMRLVLDLGAVAEMEAGQ